jgi:hypothetical protein
MEVEAIPTNLKVRKPSEPQPARFANRPKRGANNSHQADIYTFHSTGTLLFK